MEEFTLDKELHINYIINNFDFYKVHKIMKDLNWKWHLGTGKYDVPTPEQIEESAISLLNMAYDKNAENISSGGLLVTKYEDNLELSFVLEECSSHMINLELDDKDPGSYERLKKNRLRKNKILKIDEKQNT